MKTTIPGTDIQTTRLGFGTASLHHQISSVSRQKLLAAAFDSGIRHFDSAPYYGHGVAERELGIFASPRRSEIVVAAKVGILPNPLFHRFPLAMYAAKAIDRLRGAGARPAAAPAYIPLDSGACVAAAERSLARTLKALRSDHVDLLLLHEPSALIDRLPDELVQWFLDAKKSGRTRYAGIAGEAEVAMRLAATATDLAEVLQVSDSVGLRQADCIADARRELQVTYGYFRTGRGTGMAARSLLEGALTRNPRGVVLFSSNQESHIVATCRMAQELLRSEK